MAFSSDVGEGSVILKEKDDQVLNQVSFLPGLDVHRPCHVDWSRATRNKLALLKAGRQPNQLKITSFFDCISNLINQNQVVKNAFSAVQERRGGMQVKDVSPLLK